MSGYDLPMSEIKRFRQLHSKTPGHPEFGETPGRGMHNGPAGPGSRQLSRHFRRDKNGGGAFQH